MKTYPKKKITTFVGEEARQVNIHFGKVWNYWFIQPYRVPFKTKKGQIPVILKTEDLDESVQISIK